MNLERDSKSSDFQKLDPSDIPFNKGRISFLAFAGCLGGFTFGYNYSILDSAKAYLAKDFPSGILES